jgi:hypothetical protein
MTDAKSHLPAPAHSLILQKVLDVSPSPEVTDRLKMVHGELLAKSHHVRSVNFDIIHPRDLEILFDAYDSRFFGNRFSHALAGRRPDFRLSPTSH